MFKGRSVPISYTNILKINDIRKYSINYFYMLYNMFFTEQWREPLPFRGWSWLHGWKAHTPPTEIGEKPHG